MDRSNSISNRLKHRIAQMLLSSSCTATSITNISDKISQEPGFPALSELHVRSRGKLDHPPHRMAPIVRVSIDCSGRRSFHDPPSPNLPLTPEEEKSIAESGVVYETGAGEGRKCPPASSSPPSNDYYCSYSKERKKAMAAKKKDKFVRKKKKKALSNGYGFSGSSSIGSNDGFGFFSSEEGEEEEEQEEEEEEEEEETWTLFSSKSFSSDSSEFYHRRPSSKKTTKHKKSTRRPPGRVTKYFEDSWDEGCKFQASTPISFSRGKKKKAPKAAEARTGFAVVKQSSNPYEDFRSSMVEMIVERQMREPEDLEQLLHSYLSLNSPCHHPAILEAFADIWESTFGKS